MTDSKKTEPGKLIPINGREAWLTDDTPLVEATHENGVKINTPFGVKLYALSGWFDRSDELSIVSIRLPADDPVYTILPAGLPLFDGKTGFMPWRGGDEAPADYGGRVLLRIGDIAPQRKGWDWHHDKGAGDIIAYEPAQAAQPVSASSWRDRMTPEIMERMHHLAKMIATGNYDLSGIKCVSEVIMADLGPDDAATDPPDPWTAELLERALAFIRREADKGETTAKALLAEIEPEPVDPLDAVWDALPSNLAGCVDASDRFRAELAKRDGRIVFEGDK